MAEVSISHIREIRMFLYEESQFNRQSAKILRDRNMPDSAFVIDAHADKCIRFVQVLNDFFPVGDYAEEDLRKARAKLPAPKRVG